MEVYLHSPIHLEGVVLNYTQGLRLNYYTLFRKKIAISTIL